VSQKALAIVIIIIIVVGIPWASRTLRSATSATATTTTSATAVVVSTPVVVVSVIVEIIVERIIVKIVAIVAVVAIVASVLTIPTTAVVRVEIIVVSGIAIVKSGAVGVVIAVIEVVVIVVVEVVVVSGIAVIVVFSWASRSSLASGTIVSRSTSNVKIAITFVIREIVGGVAGAIAGRTVILLIPIFSRTSWPPLAWFGIVGVSVGIVRRSCGVTLFLEFSRHLNFHVLPQDLKNFTSIHVLASNVIQVIGVFKYHKTVTKWTIASNHDLE